MSKPHQMSVQINLSSAPSESRQHDPQKAESSAEQGSPKQPLAPRSPPGTDRNPHSSPRPCSTSRFKLRIVFPANESHLCAQEGTDYDWGCTGKWNSLAEKAIKRGQVWMDRNVVLEGHPQSLWDSLLGFVVISRQSSWGQ